MRIIAGTRRGLRLDSLDGLATRPTLDRVKEAVFSSAAPEIPGARVLDLFAGSGALGLEALSRGAAACTFVDDSAAAMAVVRKNAEKARFLDGAAFVRSDWRAFVMRYDGPAFDLVFLDPPYKLWEGAGILDLLHMRGLLQKNALVVAESARNLLPAAERLTLLKQKQYGTAAITYWRNEDEYCSLSGQL